MSQDRGPRRSQPSENPRSRTHNAIKPSFKRTNAKMRHRSGIFIRASKARESSAPNFVNEPARAPGVLPLCTNCNSSLHTLDRCLYAPKGAIYGCPFCKNETHQMEEYGQFAVASASDIVQALVWDRPNMPAWDTRLSWLSYLTKFLSTEEFRALAAQSCRQAVLAAPFPWTRKFSRNFAQGNDLARLQAEFNDGISANLPADPSTAGIVAACKSYGIALERFWPEIATGPVATEGTVSAPGQTVGEPTLTPQNIEAEDEDRED